MTKSLKKDSENTKGGINRNLLAGAIALVILVVVAGWYLDRQGRRNYAQIRTEGAIDLLDEWGRGTRSSRSSWATANVRAD